MHISLRTYVHTYVCKYLQLVHVYTCCMSPDNAWRLVIDVDINALIVSDAMWASTVGSVWGLWDLCVCQFVNSCSAEGRCCMSVKTVNL